MEAILQRLVDWNERSIPDTPIVVLKRIIDDARDLLEKQAHEFEEDVEVEEPKESEHHPVAEDHNDGVEQARDDAERQDDPEKKAVG